MKYSLLPLARSLALLLAGAVVATAELPVPSDAKTLRDLAYVADGHERQKLDLFLPGSGTKRPLVVWIHGGGWEGGSKAECPALPLVARGYAVASIGYRLSQHAHFPAQIEDCKAAIRFLRAHAEEYGIDSAHIGVWGASAGGHLAALLGTSGGSKAFDKGANLDQPSNVQAVLDWFGPVDFTHWGVSTLQDFSDPASPVVKLFGGPIREHAEAVRQASPLTFVDQSAAPFLIMHGDEDRLVPLQQSEALDAALKAAGVESHLEIIHGAGHGSAAFLTPEMLQLMGGFFERHLRAPAKS